MVPQQTGLPGMSRVELVQVCLSRLQGVLQAHDGASLVRQPPLHRILTASASRWSAAFCACSAAIRANSSCCTCRAAAARKLNPVCQPLSTQQQHALLANSYTATYCCGTGDSITVPVLWQGCGKASSVLTSCGIFVYDTLLFCTLIHCSTLQRHAIGWIMDGLTGCFARRAELGVTQKTW